MCQKINRKLTTDVPQLHPIPVVSPWQCIEIDFIGPLSPIATDGSKFILTISDYFSKYVEVVPTPDKCSSHVASLAPIVVHEIWITLCHYF